jgi:soluble lytic murein transglycosylase-like protein
MTWWLAVFLMQSTFPQGPIASNRSPAKQNPVKLSPQAQADRVRAAMADSLAAQRASVRRQTEAAGTASPLASSVPNRTAICDALSQPELARMIDVAARREEVDPLLVREVARQESGFRPCAVSSKGAAGLMQLMPATQVQLQVQNPFSAQESLEAGSKLLKQLLDRYHGDLPQALSAYNAGPARVDAAGGVPKIPETQNYVSSILNRLLPAMNMQAADTEAIVSDP